MTHDHGALMTHADVNRLSLHYEEHGSGEPLLLLHGGIGAGAMFAPILPALAEGRRVITVDLQGHGGTADVDRPLGADLMADDIAALLDHLGLEQADVMGYSLGGKVALRLAIQHPARVRRLVLVSVAFRRDGSHPEVLAAMDQMSAAAAEPMMQSPLYAQYERLPPRGGGRAHDAVAALRAVRAARAARRGLAGADRQDRRVSEGRLRLGRRDREGH